MSTTLKAVFLSYASQDAEPAGRLAEALRAAGVEVWFDQNEPHDVLGAHGLVGGDAWDAKIRKQIKDCALFVPVISANTQARTEGYFRLEWRLADQRTHLMAKGRPFLLPVVIDDTRDADAHVPESFMEVQWTRLRQAYGGQAPDDAGVAAFCARVKRLLESGTGILPVIPGHGQGAHATPAAASTPVRRKPSSPWRLAAIAGLAVTVAIGLWQPWKNFPFGNKAATAAPLTEARQLTLKARALIDDDLMAVRENFRLAEELCERAVKLAPDDGEAWATLARVSAAMINRRYDTTTPRMAAARTQAERAIRLAPYSVEAGLAMAPYLLGSREWAELERRMRVLQARAPNDARVLLMLAKVLNEQSKDAEATEIRLNHPAFGDRDPRPLVDESKYHGRKGRMAEAESFLDRAQALAPSHEGYYAKLMTLLRDSHFKEAARLFLENLPPQLLLEDAFAGHAAEFWIRLGSGDKALAVLRRVPRDFFEDAGQVLPKGYYSGWAQRVAGRATAAEAEWRQAALVVEKRLAAEPNQPELLRWKGLLLALTGQTEAADKTWKLLLELEARPAGRVRWPDVEFYLALGRSEDAIRALEAMRAGGSLGPPRLAGWLRHEPWLEPVRNDPRVQEFIAQQEARLRESRERGAGASSTPTTPPVSPQQKSIAVLAFRNLSDDQGSEYFSDGISEELANVLGRVPGLRVAGSTSAFSFKGKAVPVPEIARQLGVSHVVEGTVGRDGHRVRITARLLNAATGFQVWASENFDREVQDSLALQEEIAGLIAKNLSLKLGASSPAATVNPEAFRLYLEGREAWNQRAGASGGGASTETAEALFQRAIVLDPGFARAHASLALLWSRNYGNAGGAEAAPELGVRARAAVERALALDPNLAEAQTAQARMLWNDGRYAEATVAFQRAIALNPNDATARHWYGAMISSRGKLAEGLAELELATRLDPLAPIVTSNYSSHLRSARRWQEALAAADRALEVRPNFGEPLRVRVDALIGLGRLAEARTAYQATLDPDVSRTTVSVADRVRQLARLGDGAGAASLADSILAAPANASAETVLLVYVALNRVDEGFAYLESTGRRFNPRRMLPWFLDPDLDRIRDDPRFERELEKAGILAEYRAAWAEFQEWQKKNGGQTR